MIKDFDYFKAKTLKEACSLLTKYGEEAKPIAGGNGLLILMKEGLIAPKYLIDLEGLTELSFIRSEKGGIRIGALTTLRQIETSSIVRQELPVLSYAMSLVGSVQVRNRATLGGILCHADPSSDGPPIALTLDAKLKLRGPKAARTVAAREFFLDAFTVATNPDEILQEVLFPTLPANTKGTYLKFNPRSAGDYALVGLAVFLTKNGSRSKVKDARIALTGVAPRAFRAESSEALLKGKSLTAELIQEAARLAAQACDPVSDVRASAEYRREMVKVLLEETITNLYQT